MIALAVLVAAAAGQTPPEPAFPEPTLAMAEACLADAVDRGRVSKDDGSWKYICSGQPAQVLWNHLVSLGVESWEQKVESGTWLSHAFPMGGCFRQLKDADGKEATSGLSCTIWIPRG